MYSPKELLIICLATIVFAIVYYIFFTKVFTKKCSCGFRADFIDRYCRKCGEELPASYLKVRKFNKRIQEDLERAEDIVDLFCDFSEFHNSHGCKIEYVFNQSQSKNGTIYRYEYCWNNCFPCRRIKNIFEIIVDYVSLQVKYLFNNDEIDINLSNETLLYVFQEGGVECLE